MGATGRKHRPHIETCGKRCDVRRRFPSTGTYLGLGLLIGVRDGGGRGAAAPQFGEFVDMNSGREATLLGQNTIHV